MLRLIQLSLAKSGCDIITARDGSEALALASREKPDLIVMDVVMPVMDGRTALARLKSDPATAGIPVILLTARGLNMTPADAEALGAACYFTKPFSPTQLLAAAQRLLGS